MLKMPGLIPDRSKGVRSLNVLQSVEADQYKGSDPLKIQECFEPTDPIPNSEVTLYTPQALAIMQGVRSLI